MIDEKRCVIEACNKTLTIARREKFPRAVTCSAACSAIHKRAINREIDRRWKADHRKKVKDQQLGREPLSAAADQRMTVK